MTSSAYAANAVDGVRTYFEDDGGDAAPLLVYGGFMDPIALSRSLSITVALAPRFRLIFADHRGHGRSDKPHHRAAYALPLRVADVLAVLDGLRIERAHFLGLSWGARLGFALAEHAPHRVISLVLCGNQPYAWDLKAPIAQAIRRGLEDARDQGMTALLRVFENLGGKPIPEPQRTWLLDNDPAALSAAFESTQDEGPISADISGWRTPCLIIAGEGDEMHGAARKASTEIPGAQFISLPGLDHLSAIDELHTVAPQVLSFMLGRP